MYKCAEQRILRLRRELLGQERFGAGHGQPCAEGFQFQARGAFGRLDFRPGGCGDFLGFGASQVTKTLRLGLGVALRVSAEIGCFEIEAGKP